MWSRSEWNLFLIKRCTITIPISWYQSYVKPTKISEVIHILVNFGRVFNPLLRRWPGSKFISQQKIHNHNTYQLIPNLCQTNKDFRSYQRFFFHPPPHCLDFSVCLFLMNSNFNNIFFNNIRHRKIGNMKPTVMSKTV